VIDKVPRKGARGGYGLKNRRSRHR